jgi:aminoglycoside phosphotransferase (APT) family kinase protein
MEKSSVTFAPGQDSSQAMHGLRRSGVPAAPAPADDGRMRETLERLLMRVEGRPARIEAMSRRPSEFASLFPADVVVLSLHDGRQLSFFVKRLGTEQADHPEKQRRDREIRIYEELFAGADLPTVRYFGTEWDEVAQRQDLFLEQVRDWDLRYQELEHWFTAARQLASLHAHFAARLERLLACDYLLRLDVEYHRGWAERAVQVARSLDATLSASLSRVVERYDLVTELLGRQPATLVHNDLAPKNILADRARAPARISIVDWETAGVGCGLLDLVDLMYGLDPVSTARMRAEYRAVLVGTGLLPHECAEFDRLIAACELLKTVHRIAHAVSWCVPPTRVALWVGEAESALSRVTVR